MFFLFSIIPKYLGKTVTLPSSPLRQTDSLEVGEATSQDSISCENTVQSFCHLNPGAGSTGGSDILYWYRTTLQGKGLSSIWNLQPEPSNELCVEDKCRWHTPVLQSAWFWAILKSKATIHVAYTMHTRGTELVQTLSEGRVPACPLSESSPGAH